MVLNQKIFHFVHSHQASLKKITLMLSGEGGDTPAQPKSGGALPGECNGSPPTYINRLEKVNLLCLNYIQ